MSLCCRRTPFPHVVEIPHVVGYPSLSDPVMFKLPIQTPGIDYSTLQPQPSYVSFAPPEVIEQMSNFLMGYINLNIFALY